MKRRNFFSGLFVAGEDMNGALSDAEVALQQFVADVGSGGWVIGGSLMANYPTPNLLTRLPGSNIGYSSVCSYRLFATDLTINPLIAGDTAIGEGGDPDGTPIDLPAAGNEKWVSIGIVFKRLRTDKRVHPVDGTEIFHLYHESFVVRVAEGEEALLGAGQRPLTDFLRESEGEDGLLVGDIRLTNGMTAIGTSDIHLNRVKPFAFSVADGLAEMPQVFARASDFWPGLVASVTTPAWNGKIVFSDYPDSVSRLSIAKVTVRAKDRRAQTDATVVEFDNTADFSSGSTFTLTLATGSGEDSHFAETASDFEYIVQCNQASNETPLYWRFSTPGSHQNICIEVEYARVA